MQWLQVMQACDSHGLAWGQDVAVMPLRLVCVKHSATLLCCALHAG